MRHPARLHAKVARQRRDVLHQTSAGLIARFGALPTEMLGEANRVHSGGARKKGLNRQIHAALQAAFLAMIRTTAEETGSWYEGAPTRKVKPAQRCHGPCGPQCACRTLPDEKKTPSDRHHFHNTALLGAQTTRLRAVKVVVVGPPETRRGHTRRQRSTCRDRYKASCSSETRP